MLYSNNKSRSDATILFNIYMFFFSPPPNVNPGISPRSQKQYQGLVGPSYQLTLAGDRNKHKLPQPQALKVCRPAL